MWFLVLYIGKFSRYKIFEDAAFSTFLRILYQTIIICTIRIFLVADFSWL